MGNVIMVVFTKSIFYRNINQKNVYKNIILFFENYMDLFSKYYFENGNTLPEYPSHIEEIHFDSKFDKYLSYKNANQFHNRIYEIISFVINYAFQHYSSRKVKIDDIIEITNHLDFPEIIVSFFKPLKIYFQKFKPIYLENDFPVVQYNDQIDEFFQKVFDSLSNNVVVFEKNAKMFLYQIISLITIISKNYLNIHGDSRQKIKELCELILEGQLIPHCTKNIEKPNLEQTDLDIPELADYSGEKLKLIALIDYIVSELSELSVKNAVQRERINVNTIHLFLSWYQDNELIRIPMFFSKNFIEFILHYKKFCFQHKFPFPINNQQFFYFVWKYRRLTREQDEGVLGQILWRF